MQLKMSMRSFSFTSFVKYILIGYALANCNALSEEIWAKDFQDKVIKSNDVWMLEFYSDMCGSCQQFAPVWKELEGKIKAIKLGKISIDNKENMKLAQSLGVLEQGLPNVQLYNSLGTNAGITIVSGEEATTKQVLYQLKNAVTGLLKADDGYYKKK